MNQSPGKELIQNLLTSNKVNELLELLKTFSLLSNITEYCSEDKSLHIKRKEKVVIFYNEEFSTIIKAGKEHYKDIIDWKLEDQDKDDEFEIFYHNQKYTLKTIKENLAQYCFYEISFYENNIKHALKFEQTQDSIVLISINVTKPVTIQKETFELNVVISINETTQYKKVKNSDEKLYMTFATYLKISEIEFIRISLKKDIFRVFMSFDEYLKNANFFYDNNLYNVAMSNIAMATALDKDTEEESLNYLKIKQYFNYIKKENDHQLSKSIVECVLYNKQINKEYKELYSITKDIDFSFLENVLLSNNTLLLSAFESKDSSKISYNEIKTC